MLDFLEPVLVKNLFTNVSNHTSTIARGFILGSTADDSFDRLVINTHHQMEDEVTQYVQ